MSENHDLQLTLNKAIDKMRKEYGVRPTFKTTETNYGIKTEIFFTSSYPVSVGFYRVMSNFENNHYINSMLEAIKNLDKSFAE